MTSQELWDQVSQSHRILQVGAHAPAMPSPLAPSQFAILVASICDRQLGAAFTAAQEQHLLPIINRVEEQRQAGRLLNVLVALHGTAGDACRADVLVALEAYRTTSTIDESGFRLLTKVARGGSRQEFRRRVRSLIRRNLSAAAAADQIRATNFLAECDSRAGDECLLGGWL